MHSSKVGISVAGMEKGHIPHSAPTWKDEFICFTSTIQSLLLPQGEIIWQAVFEINLFIYFFLRAVRWCPFVFHWFPIDVPLVVLDVSHLVSGPGGPLLRTRFTPSAFVQRSAYPNQTIWGCFGTPLK